MLSFVGMELSLQNSPQRSKFLKDVVWSVTPFPFYEICRLYFLRMYREFDFFLYPYSSTRRKTVAFKNITGDELGSERYFMDYEKVLTTHSFYL